MSVFCFGVTSSKKNQQPKMMGKGGQLIQNEVKHLSPKGKIEPKIKNMTGRNGKGNIYPNGR
jgi:hypothetical protein